MANERPPERPAPEDALREEVARRAQRHARAERERDRSVWFGLGTFGLVGWSVAIPTLLGIGLGLYLDAHHPARFSWVLTLLFVGVLLGCANAWYWIQQERGRD